ncbi:MAG: hypothetical protein LBH40_02125 [Alphaproteobacteria bacterium]|jgi:hypothetical protein|nr:hypothetical protein [Alphaproteobacteria bacterium]
MYNGTIRHLLKGDNRELGTYEEDDFKSHNHDMSHDHDMSHQHWYNAYQFDGAGPFSVNRDANDSVRDHET